MRHPQPIYDFVMSRLQATKSNWPAIAQEVPISLSTLRKIARREVENPGVRHIEKLAKYFRDQAAA